MPEREKHISAERLTAFAHSRAKLSKTESSHFDGCRQCQRELRDAVRRLRSRSKNT